jgi:hypothetical protein
MKSDYLKNKVGRVLLAFSFLMSIGVVSATAVQAQWRDRDNRRDQNRDYRRDRDNRRNDDYRNDQYRRNNGGYGSYGSYGNSNQVAINQGYQDGLYTGANDGQRGQSYNPQRSHFYREAGNNRYGGGYYAQAYRQGFVRGYDEGYRRNNNRNRRYGNTNRFPFPW